MDLTGLLLRVASTRPHVFVAAVPGQPATRLGVEAEIGRRGWPMAESPAEADLLVVAGWPGPRLAPVVETVWSQMPAPRARLVVTAATDVADALDAGVRDLADLAAQRRAPAAEPAASPYVVGPATSAGHDMSGGCPGHHPEHHTHGGAMAMPGGIPMADLGEDRDGLMLDALHVRLGPLLPDWPAGLVLRVVLQGDVITEAEAEVYDSPAVTAGFWVESRAGESVTVGDVARRAAAGHLDGLSRFLGTVGWADPAARSRWLRDALLAGAPTREIALGARGLTRRVARSRTLRWLIRGIPAGDDDVAGRLSARLKALDAALESLDDAHLAAQTDPDRLAGGRIAPGELAPLLVGTEFAAARLVVAVLDPDTDVLAPTGKAAHGGHA